MKKLICFLLVFSAFGANAQTPVISSTRFGALKLGAPADSISKHIGQKITTPTREEDLFQWDTIRTVYKGVPVRLVFDHELMNGVYSSHLNSIYTESADVATRSGIKAGHNKFDVIKKLDGSMLYLRPAPEISANTSLVILEDLDNNTEVYFYFRDNILYAIELTVSGEGC